VTGPFRDTEIVLARDTDRSREAILRAQFPDREVIYLIGGAFTHDPAAP